MFDPTVFDNLKVVIEGAVYDLDLHGEFVVLNRKDIVDLATMKREYTITLKNKSHHPKLQSGKIQLSMDLENISGELLQKSRFTPGCKIQIGLSLIIPDPKEPPKKIEGIIKSIWGAERTMKQTLSYTYSKTIPEYYNNHVVIDFNRLIGEDNVEDILDMLHYLCTTLDTLDAWLKKE